VTEQPNTPLKPKSKIPWYVYFFGAIIYTILASWLFRESDSPVLAWLCLISSPLGFFYAWKAWQQDQDK
jgi:hypothetical protein